MAQSIHSVLQVNLEYSHCPAVLDLSGEHTFDALLKVRRTNTDTDPRPITLRTTDSVLDPRAAFKNGYFELTRARGNRRVIPTPDEGGGVWGSGDAVPIAEDPEGAFVTLPSRAGGPGDLRRRAHYDVVIPLRILERFRDVLIPGRSYNLRLLGDALGVQWWSYGTKEDLPKSLPPEPARLSAQRVGRGVNFFVVNSLAPPPPISVSLSLSSSVVRRTEDSPTLRIEVTNRSDKPITLKTTGHQPHIGPDTSLPEPFPWRSIVAQLPSIENFCIRKVPLGEDCISVRALMVSYIGREGWKRNRFITLEPSEPHIREIPFLQNVSGSGVIRRMSDDGEFCIKVRDVELWWCAGTVEEIFGEENSIRFLPNSRTLPIVPRGENELSFRLES